MITTHIDYKDFKTLVDNPKDSNKMMFRLWETLASKFMHQRYDAEVYAAFGEGELINVRTN